MNAPLTPLVAQPQVDGLRAPAPHPTRPVVIVTDAWEPQVNGVVRTLKTVGEELKARGYQVEYITPQDYFTVPAPSYPEIRLSMTHWFSLGRRLRALNPLAIHIATEGPLGVAARRFCVKNHVPFTTSFHTKFPEYFAQRWRTPVSWGYAVIRWFHGPSMGVLVPTRSMRDELAGWGITNTAPWTRGVDHTKFRPAAMPAPELANLPRPISLCVGRVAVEKNLDAFLALDIPGSKVIVGDGPALEDLRKKYPDAHLMGARFGEELSGFFTGADAFVFPSRTDTFGLVVIEALASGLPVAAYPVPGPKDILADAGSAGFVDDDLQTAVLAAFNVPAEKARAHALCHAGGYTWARCADLFVNNLRGLSGL